VRGPGGTLPGATRAGLHDTVPLQELMAGGETRAAGRAAHHQRLDPRHLGRDLA
jgi:hypothetical protein